MESLYDLLDADPSASTEDLRGAYLTRICEVHPDRHQGDSTALLAESELLTKELNEAWAVLSNETRRAEYDRRLVGPQKHTITWHGETSSAPTAATDSTSRLRQESPGQEARRPKPRRAQETARSADQPVERICPSCVNRIYVSATAKQMPCPRCATSLGFLSCPGCSTEVTVNAEWLTAQCRDCGEVFWNAHSQDSGQPGRSVKTIIIAVAVLIVVIAAAITGLLVL